MRTKQIPRPMRKGSSRQLYKWRSYTVSGDAGRVKAIAVRQRVRCVRSIASQADMRLTVGLWNRSLRFRPR